MTAETLQASQLQHRDHAAAVKDYYQRGWTDGLPVILPEPAPVAAFLDAGGMPAREVVGAVPTQDVIVTAEDVAINAVRLVVRNVLGLGRAEDLLGAVPGTGTVPGKSAE